MFACLVPLLFHVYFFKNYQFKKLIQIRQTEENNCGFHFDFRA